MGALTSEKERDQRAGARIGQMVCGKWHLDEVLGIGGIAAVYAATHRNGKRVAIKILHAEYSQFDDIRERFLEEGYVANRVGHPGVVSVLDDGVTDDGSNFLVMDFLQGETLDQRFHRYGQPFGAEEVLCIADQVLGVLIAAHDAGIVHRDIKPENIFATYSGEIKLLDFGIARVAEPRRSRTTEVGLTMGTPAFMPPEQARGRQNLISGRTDLWALGATMFWLLSGRFVREAETVNEELLQAMTRSAPSLRTLPDIPQPVAELVDQALQFDVENRWPDARSMQAAVRQVYALITGADHAHTVPPEVAQGKAELPPSGLRRRKSSPDERSATSEPPRSRSYLAPAAATLTTHPPVATSTWPGRTRPTKRAGVAVLGPALLAAAGFAVVHQTHLAASNGVTTSTAVSVEVPSRRPIPTLQPERSRVGTERRDPEPSAAIERETTRPKVEARSSDLPTAKTTKRKTKRSAPGQGTQTGAPTEPANALQDEDPLSRRK